MALSDIYPMFIEPTITLVPSGSSEYIRLDTKIVLKIEIFTINLVDFFVEIVLIVKVKVVVVVVVVVVVAVPI